MSNDNYAIYQINVTKTFGAPEYKDLFNDLIRFLIIQISIQFMLSISDDSYSFFTFEFLTLLLFITIGVLAYWLIFRKFVSFT